MRMNTRVSFAVAMTQALAGQDLQTRMATLDMHPEGLTGAAADSYAQTR